MITSLGKSLERTAKMLEKFNKGDKSCGMNLVTEEPKFPVPCSASDCSTSLEEMVSILRPYFTDSLSTNRYCEACGCRLRYHRKMWILRGEECPVTLEEINKRHEHKK